MPKIIVLILLSLFTFRLPAQQQYYLYLQANGSQPFYARIQNAIFSSSENGYVIIPKLHDSTYEVFLGFALNAFPEQHFSIGINRQDQGFELKNFGDRGWGLQNLQTASVIMNTGVLQKTAAENTGEKKNDAFSQMLANVVNDSAILYTAARPVATTPPKSKPAPREQPAEPKQDTAAAVASTGTPPSQPPITKAAEKPAQTDSGSITKAAKKDTAATPPAGTPVIAGNPPPKTRTDTVAAAPKDQAEKPFITRIAETRTEQGYKAVYLEQYIFSTDTILVEIPAAETAPVSALVTPPVSTPKPPDITVAKPAASAPKSSDTAAAAQAGTVTAVAADTAGRRKQPVVINSDCRNFASDGDVDKLRVKMLAENAVDDKLATARKYFKTKCFTARQIRALTELFPSDESKYRFFDTAYPFVSDTENFAALDELIGNDYYKTRFRAMIRK